MADQTASPSMTQRLERLLEISRTLTSTLELTPLLELIIDVSCELTQSQVASILLFDKTSGELVFQAVPGHQRESLSKVGVPLDSSIAGWIFQNAKPMVIHDAASDPRIFRKVDRKLNFQTESLLGVPLLIKEKPIGVLEAVNKLGGGNYTEDDKVILETLAAHAAVSIENARLMSELQQANADLMRLDSMKSDFIAIASHELRTPLGLILGHSTYLKDVINPEHKEQTDVIIRSAMRLKDIIEDMSTIAHQENGQSRVRSVPFSMSQLVVEIVARYKGAAEEKRIQLDYDIPKSDKLMIEADRTKISIALGNLVENAILFTDEDGQVGIKAEADDTHLRVYVVDTGIGIPPDATERIFDRFYQVESHLTRKHGGMGLGLSIAKAMVEMHQGEIWCESKEGTGSLFCFTLPLEGSPSIQASRIFYGS